MPRKVYYYTRTGNCKKVARDYVDEDNGYLIQITDIPEDNYQGIWGFIKGGFDAVRGKEVSYRTVGDKYIEENEIVLVTPIWAGKIPPAFNSFLSEESFTPEMKVYVVTVSKSGNGRDAFRYIADRLQEEGVMEIRHRNLKESEIAI